MSDMEYVGSRVPVVMDKLFNPDGAKITWSAEKDGAACIIDLSSLDNDGGTVIFPEPGEYTLTAAVRDDAGNLTSAFANITVTNTAPVIESFTASVTRQTSGNNFYANISAIPGAEYSIDGGATWQAGNTFSGLDADKSYTILVRMAEDENHTASGTRPVTGRTTGTPVNILDTDMPAYSTVYNGNRQPHGCVRSGRKGNPDPLSRQR